VRPITEATCRDYCGRRASFDGKYRIPPASCTASGRQAQRDKFLLLYRAHRYAEAENVLGTLTSQCTDFMNWIEIDQVRNDRALSQYHNGEYSQCVETLNTTIAGQAKDVTELSLQRATSITTSTLRGQPGSIRRCVSGHWRKSPDQVLVSLPVESDQAALASSPERIRYQAMPSNS
jgi:hypothetical protein